MAELTAESIAQRAFDLNLLSDRQLQEIWSEFGRRNVTSDDFIQLLLRRELLTPLQLEKLVKDERTGYFYGDYKVLYMVAGGSFARVYRAVHKDSAKVVALKVLRKRFSDDANQTDQFAREGQMGVSLRHPNIVPIYEVCSKGRSHYLVMEFVEGGNLRDLMKMRKKLTPTEATKFACDIAAGLDYAFQRGISHRDLKLTNVLFSSRGQAKLVDFGLAGAEGELADESPSADANVRTIDYAGLERATGVRKDDARSDIYFIGCIYYHMLAGQAPLTETRDRIQRLSKTRFMNVAPIQQACPGIPRVVAAVVNKAMSFDAEKRYQSPGQMYADLRQALDRLAAGETDAAPVENEEAPAVDAAPLSPEETIKRQRQAAQYLPDSQRRSLVVVESNSQLQDTFRDALKRYGYRVLVISDPKRALARCADAAHPVDGVVVSTGELGDSGVEAFVEIATGEQTAKLPVVVLLDERHKERKGKVQPHLTDHRVLVPLPVKLKEFRDVLFRLVPPVEVPQA
ncbi:MAG TPA: serine/threonine-protein kinase [Pirellulales bacterium]